MAQRQETKYVTPKIPAKYAKAVASAKKSTVGAPLWAPKKEGDAIAGKIVSASVRDGRDGTYVQMLIDSGEESFLLRPSSILQRELFDHKVCVGAEVAIVFRGTTPSSFGPGRPAKLFALSVVKAGTGDLVIETAPVPRKGGKSKAIPKASKKAKRKG